MGTYVHLIDKVHHEKIILFVYRYIAIYGNNINLNLKIQVHKYMRILATKNLQSTIRNVYSTSCAKVYKLLHEMPRIQEHIIDCISYCNMHVLKIN